MVSKKKKVYVLDTSVLLHDHDAIKSFEDNDVAIPITVLEELDKFKTGTDTKNYEAREVIRLLDRISGKQIMNRWNKIGSDNLGRIKVVVNHNLNGQSAEHIFGSDKNDHKILNAAICLMQKEKNRKVILVTKDINLRIKAKSLNIPSEDYKTGKVKNEVSLQKGITTLEDIEAGVINKLFKDNVSEEVDVLGSEKKNNEFYILKNCKSSTLAYYSPFHNQIERVNKEHVYGIKPKNAEQAFAVHAILNPDIKLVCLQGVAGTGKTLLALAGSIHQRKRYKQIILARPIVPLSNKDIGYLPGDAQEKINPYMMPLWDNLKYIKNQFSETEKKYKVIEDMEKDGKILITPLAYIRGRSFADVIFIVDEAQNLTPHEVKTIITRAGENTKIIFTGDVQQIDTPFLDEESNGLSYLIDRLKGNKLFAHIKLEKGERSELANLANNLL